MPANDRWYRPPCSLTGQSYNRCRRFRPVRPLLDAVPAIALVALLVTAYRHPSGRTEATIGLAAAAATLATGLLSLEQLEAELRHLGPGRRCSSCTILVVADVCARAGLFAAAAPSASR